MGIESTSLKYGRQFEDFFSKNPPTFAKSLDSTMVIVGGKRYHYDNYDSVSKLLDAESAIKFDLLEWYKSPPEEKIADLKTFVEATFRRADLERSKRRAELSAKLSGDQDFELPDPDYILEMLRPCRTLGEKLRESGFKFINRETKKISEYDYHSVYYSLRRKIDREMIEEYMAHHIHLREIFDPQKEFGIERDGDSNNVYEYNRYSPPAWKSLDVKPELDKDIEDLMGHLFKSETCRQFVYTWIYHSLTSRAGTYLYLCGGQGSGKNTLATLITRLHGEHNSSNPKQDSFKTRFNYYLRDKTFIFFDEFNCRVRQDKDILKSIINKRIQIEGKGRDHEDIELFCNYFLANNSLEAIGLDPVDRRFSVPNVTDSPIVPVWGRDRIRLFLDKLKDDTYIAKFGRWLLEEFKEYKFFPEEPYQTKRFEEIVFSTARMGISETLNKLLSGEQSEYYYNDEKEAFRRQYKGHNYPSIADWQKFFRDVRKDGEPICVVDGFKLIPNKAYKPEFSSSLSELM